MIDCLFNVNSVVSAKRMTPLAKKDTQNHLDMHFRRNRKANQNIGRGHSRSWFVGVEVHERSYPSIQQLLISLHRIRYTACHLM